MNDFLNKKISEDCLAAAAATPSLIDHLNGQSISVTGGFGFVGTWIAEMVLALNRKHNTDIRLTLIGRTPKKWTQNNPHLQQPSIMLQEDDIRSPFEFPKHTTRVIHAAGIADIRVQASDPEQIYETTIIGIMNSLSAAKKLNHIENFVNISSGLVVGKTDHLIQIRETDLGIVDFKKLDNLYLEMRRASEAIANAYASQYRLPLVTARAFTFIGPYQKNNTPWAMNRFIADAVAGRDIRIIGAGKSQRTYLYGSDVSAWLLKMAISGLSREIYNLGGEEPISHELAAKLVSDMVQQKSQVVNGNLNLNDDRRYDFVPDLTNTKKNLNVKVTVDLKTAIKRTLSWENNRKTNS